MITALMVISDVNSVLTGRNRPFAVDGERLLSGRLKANT